MEALQGLLPLLMLSSMSATSRAYDRHLLRHTASDSSSWGGLAVRAEESIYRPQDSWFYRNVTSFNCSYTVPPVPKNWSKDTHHQSIFLWCGVQPGGALGVIQPQIMFGYDCVEGAYDSGVGPWINSTGHAGIHHLGDHNYSDSPYFYWSAQYVYDASYHNASAKTPKWVCQTGQLFKAELGETLLTKMW